jgi:hypothetical protein
MHDDCTPARLANGVGTGRARPPGSIDWHAVRRDYATGRLSNVELCRKHCLAPTTLSKRIRTDQNRDPTTWQRNLSGQVRTTTAALLIQEHTKGIVKAGHETAAVLAAAAATRDVILGHRKDVAAARRVWTGLLAELESTTTSRAQLAAMLAQASTVLDDAGRATLAAQHANLVQLHQRVGSIQRLADATIKLQAAERKAFGLTDEDGGSDPLDQMTEAELEAQIAALESERVAGAPHLRIVSTGG